MLKSANDIRTKIIILLIASSGMRMGAIAAIKIRNLVKNPETRNLSDIKFMKVPGNLTIKYFKILNFTNIIDSYLDYRKTCW
ncbi:MAG: hypothetical protein MRJ93_00275 [Nitrososphaeraceae archaeon]|nr:hypothetical protein [Nitrososphaeraceae archaeon]